MVLIEQIEGRLQFLEILLGQLISWVGWRLNHAGWSFRFACFHLSDSQFYNSRKQIFQQFLNLQLIEMADVDVAEVPEGEQAPQKTEEQLLEEERAKQEERKQQQEERKRVQEQARVKKEEDMRKLEEALKGAASGLAKTSDHKSVAFVKLVLAQKQLQRIFPSILKFNEIQHLDLNTNALTDISIAADFSRLLTLNVSKNQIPDLSVFQADDKLAKLQFLNLSGNKIKQLAKLALPSLKKLNLSQNQIEKAEEWKGHPNIEILELRKNKLKKLKGLGNMKKLSELYVCENEITDIRGLENLPCLIKLSVRNNKLKGFMTPFPFLPSLQHLNLRENQFTSLKELGKVDEHLKSINLLANPVTDELGQNFKKEMVWQFPRFIRVNKSAVTEEERNSFEKERLEKVAQEEKERLEKEEEARKGEQQPEA